MRRMLSGSGHPSGVDIKGAYYNIQCLLGEGGYGYVYLGYDSTHSPLALKRFVVHEPEHQERFLDEVRIHRQLSPHPTIVGFVESAIKQNSGPLPEVWLSMEYCQGPSLQALVNQAMMERQGSLPRQMILQIASDVVDAVAHMHSQSPPIAHWDLKLDNVLKSTASDGAVTWKLCDFGSASALYYLCRNPQEIQIAETELKLRMTTLYQAPETLDLWTKRRVDTKVDMWNLGVLLYTLVMMEMPFEENPLEIIAGVPKIYQNVTAVSGKASVAGSWGLPNSDAHLLPSWPIFSS